MSSEALATSDDNVRIERNLVVLKWMLGLVIAGMSAQILKSIFG